MTLKREKVSMKDEKRIITNMITSTEFLKQTQHIIKSYLLKSSYAKSVANWCLEYYENTKVAPGRDIKDVYIRKRKELEDEEEVELVSEFLQNLSRSWEDSQINNTGYEVKNAIKYIKLRRLENLKEQLEVAILEGNDEQGEECVSNFEKVETITSSMGVALLEDCKAVEEAFQEELEILFKFPGALGKLIGNLCRGDFLLLLGGPKSGKSFFLWFIAHRGALMGFKMIVLNFEMSKNQYTRRGWQSLHGLPAEDELIKLPQFEEDPDGDGYVITYREEKRKSVKSLDIKTRQKFYKKAMRGGNIRIESFTSGQSTFEDVVTRLNNLEYYEDFIPDGIIWDYPDIMKLKGGNQTQHRHSLDELSTQIRGYAQDKNCLCAAASQVNASAWDKDIKASDADENKKKANHVTQLLALNHTKEELEAGVARIEMLYRREGKPTCKQVTVLQCLSIGRFYMDSKFRKDVIWED